MKLLKTLMFSLVSMAVLAGCPEHIDKREFVDLVRNVQSPGSTVNYQAAFANALQCATNSVLVWEYSGQVVLGAAYNPVLDGSVEQTGIFHAPACGSVLVGTTVDVRASCTGADGVYRTATARISVPQELLSYLEIGAAVVRECGAPACLAANPLAINLRLCLSTEPNSTIQFYSHMGFTCSDVWNPEVPPTAGVGPGQLPLCDPAISQ